MTADIVNIVDGKFSGRSFIHLPAGGWVDLRAEIVRLRGEVEALRQCGIKYLGWLGVKDAEKALRKDMADPEMVERPAPAMPNGVEGLVQNFLDKEVHPTVRDWENRNLAGISILKHWRDFLISLTHAADNRDAAGVDSEEDAYVIERMGKLLAEIAVIVNGPEPAATRWSYHDLPDKVRALKTTPAAVPAGEVCGTCNGVGMIGGHRGQTPDSFEQWAEDCPDCTPQPADGEAVAPLGYVRRKAISAMREDDEVTGIMVHVDAPSDSVPVYLHPPAPVQAAPQEGEQDTSHWPLLDRVEFALRDAGFDYDEAFRIAHMAAHPSACELGAVRELVDDFTAKGHHSCARDLEAALQHRGDSQEVGRG